MADPVGDPRDRRTGRAAEMRASLEGSLAERRARWGAVETAAQVVERDRDAAGTLLGSALAMRLFLFLVPLTLFAIGVAGLLGLSDVGSFSSAAEVDGRLAREIDQAFDQNATSAALATAIGFSGTSGIKRSLQHGRRALLYRHDIDGPGAGGLAVSS
jgi:hypothetical protein